MPNAVTAAWRGFHMEKRRVKRGSHLRPEEVSVSSHSVVAIFKKSRFLVLFCFAPRCCAHMRHIGSPIVVLRRISRDSHVSCSVFETSTLFTSDGGVGLDFPCEACFVMLIAVWFFCSFRFERRRVCFDSACRSKTTWCVKMIDRFGCQHQWL